MDQLRIINASLQSDCVMIVFSLCKGKNNIRKLPNKLGSVVTKTVVKLDQYEDKLNEMETKLEDSRRGEGQPNGSSMGERRNEEILF